MDASLAIDSNGLARRFGSRWVLRGATLRLEAGQAAGLVGANGSGKSTLLRVLATLLRPNAGSARVFGADVVADADAVRDQVGLFLPVAGMYDDLTARENLQFAAHMLGRAPADADVELERVGLASVAGERARGFSSGMLRRLALGRLRLQRPRLLLLDEPYNNFDAGGIALVNATIRETLERGGAALVVVHDVGSADAVLRQWFALAEGRVVAADSAAGAVTRANARASGLSSDAVGAPAPGASADAVRAVAGA